MSDHKFHVVSVWGARMSDLREIMEEQAGFARSGRSEVIREVYAGSSRQTPLFLSISQFRHHEVRVDEPASFGGSDTAANPAEVLLAAIAASAEVTVRAWSAYLGIECGEIGTDIAGDLDLRGFMDTDPDIRAGFGPITLKIHVSGDLSAEDVARLERVVRRSCPIFETVENGSPINLRVMSTAGALS